MDFKNIEKQGERKIYLPNSGKQPFNRTHGYFQYLTSLLLPVNHGLGIPSRIDIPKPRNWCQPGIPHVPLCGLGIPYGL